MSKLARHMDQSPDGWLSYRRRVPTGLVKLIGKREIKHAYKTKSEIKALKLHASFHEQVEKMIAEAKAMAKHLPSAFEQKSKTPSEIFMEMYKSAKEQNYLPSQVDSLNATMTIDEQLAFASEHLRYAEAVKLCDADQITGDELTEVINSITNKSVRNFINHQEYLRLLEDADGLTEHGQQLLKILKGDYTPPEPTIIDLFDRYIDEKRSETNRGQRNQKQQIKLENSIKRIVNLVASAHKDGEKTQISELDATAIKDMFERQFDRIATLQRNYSDAAAAVALWNKRNKTKQIDNPFADLREELPVNDSKKEERRVWHPEEYDLFWNTIKSEPDPSRRIMGMLMAYAGKPQGETAGLVRDDIKLNYEVPHILFRSNQYRGLNKKRQENMLPLVGEMLEEIQEYISTFSRGEHDLLFPSLFVMDTGSRSKAVKKHAKEMYPISNMLFQPYGLRHTFKPRYEAAGVDPIKGMYLFGHKNGLTSKTHDGYAKGLNRLEDFKELRDDMMKVMEVKTWTYSYIISDFD